MSKESEGINLGSVFKAHGSHQRFIKFGGAEQRTFLVVVVFLQLRIRFTGFSCFCEWFRCVVQLPRNKNGRNSAAMVCVCVCVCPGITRAMEHDLYYR